ncbi:uncharacterized protein LOC135926345 isoform X2 [Gordionus sp. m RMFG-2023]|uniref:uncharacterized protein LOC135926345 isoform X2 n=1 Tax=Gordionus sp. m RMFG-2023 TaxID=3053472 RepID=UPI0031FDD713
MKFIFGFGIILIFCSRHTESSEEDKCFTKPFEARPEIYLRYSNVLVNQETFDLELQYANPPNQRTRNSVYELFAHPDVGLTNPTFVKMGNFRKEDLVVIKGLKIKTPYYIYITEDDVVGSATKTFPYFFKFEIENANMFYQRSIDLYDGLKACIVDKVLKVTFEFDGVDAYNSYRGNNVKAIIYLIPNYGGYYEETVEIQKIGNRYSGQMDLKNKELSVEKSYSVDIKPIANTGRAGSKPSPYLLVGRVPVKFTAEDINSDVKYGYFQN